MKKFETGHAENCICEVCRKTILEQSTEISREIKRSYRFLVWTSIILATINIVAAIFKIIE
ncbi:hypothetical protein EFA69_16085 [Rufibacter immobilis]|uniref:Uncharacterized protein n=1 Tax=Rufibacter immobilis TaxID=1348778 RepID=A0A3M9MQ46_9BACT|nr:hypothetical protein [Rufibacter immobilis]RNI27636.1 hypothetical protein EFA69_16085 [Rufibacter immobilis]